MMGFILVIHSIVCVFLLLAILMQSGRGGGLTEQFASAESVFGAQTNVFMVRTTSVLATIFFITCLSLAFMSARQERSLVAEHLPAKKISDMSIPVQPVKEAVMPLNAVMPSSDEVMPVEKVKSVAATVEAAQAAAPEVQMPVTANVQQ